MTAHINPYTMTRCQWTPDIYYRSQFSMARWFWIIPRVCAQHAAAKPQPAYGCHYRSDWWGAAREQGAGSFIDRTGQELFITGVNGHVSLQEIMNLWKRPIIQQDSDDCCIVLDHKARNTIQNAQETRTWAKQENIKTLRLVTSDYHMPRARWEFLQNMPGTTILAWPVKAHDDDSEMPDFVRLAFDEYNKTLLTLIKVYLMPDWARSRVSHYYDFSALHSLQYFLCVGDRYCLHPGSAGPAYSA